MADDTTAIDAKPPEQAPRDDGLHLERAIAGEDGTAILLEETSGSAYAEAAVIPARASAEDGAHNRLVSRALLAIGAGLVAGFVGRRLWARRGKLTGGRHAVAFAHNQTDPENFAQTRNAGAMRDRAQGWDAIDETLDQSFPASDPPNFDLRDS